LIPNPLDSLYELSKKIAIRHHNLKTDFSNWDEKDFRIAVYSRNTNLVESVLFSMIFRNEQLTDKNWYKKIKYIKSPTESQIYSTSNNYELNLRVWLIIGYLSSVESFFRFLIKQTNPELEYEKFWKICEEILKKYELTLYQQNFDFYRFIRNSIHNNGIVTDKNAYSIMFGGAIYEIKMGRPIKVNWPMLCQLTLELDTCLEKIIRVEEVSSLDVTPDPSFY